MYNEVMWPRRVLVGSTAAVLLVPPDAEVTPVPVITPVVVGVIPHDPAAYSEGLEFDGGDLYESTGEETKSNCARWIRRLAGCFAPSAYPRRTSARALPLSVTAFGS